MTTVEQILEGDEERIAILDARVAQKLARGESFTAFWLREAYRERVELDAPHLGTDAGADAWFTRGLVQRYLLGAVERGELRIHYEHRAGYRTGVYTSGPLYDDLRQTPPAPERP